MSGPIQLAPAPGVAVPGDLYVDLQSRQIWLGVDAAVDPAQAVLVSDIISLQAADTTTLNNAKAYTDTQIQTRAPTSHTHVSTQITDFNTAVDARITANTTNKFAIGMILMYSGSMANIGVGALQGWALCDGSQGTPDLRDRFVIGAGNKANNSINTPAANLTTGAAGAHTHTINGTSITVAQMPSHAHTASLSGSCSGSTGAAGAHAHGNASDGNNFVTAGGSLGSGSGLGYKQTAGTSAVGDHTHSFSGGASVSGTVDANGSGAAHTHTESAAADHQHTVPALTFREMIPYLALAYIMKIT